MNRQQPHTIEISPGAPENRWSWRLLARLFGFFAAFVRALLQTVWGRIRRRPRHPAWRFSVELVVRTVRIAVESALETLEVARLIPPATLPPHLPGRVKQGNGIVGGRAFESFTPRDWKAGDGVCLYLHGGGYAVCSPATHRLLVSEVALATGMRCYSLDYRLAPEHPFPAALDDALAAWAELRQAHVEESLWIGGDSAGGGLALATMLRLRQRSLPMPTGALLFSPWVDLTGGGESIATNDAFDYLPARKIGRFAQMYRGQTPLEDPLISPMFADMTGLPPLIMVTGGAELFASENATLAENAVQAGVKVHHLVHPDLVHVYPALLPFERETREAFRFIRRRFTEIMSGNS